MWKNCECGVKGKKLNAPLDTNQLAVGVITLKE